MLWLWLAIIAYLILAIVNLLDKFFIDQVIPSSKTYTFLVGCLGILAWLAAPWYLQWPGAQMAGLNIIVGALFPIGLLLFYRALKEGEASRVLVMIGGLTPVFSIILSIVILDRSYSLRHWLALVLLIIGTVIIAWMPSQKNWLAKILKQFHFRKKSLVKSVVSSALAAFMLALFFIGNKYIFLHQDFVSAFIWLRLGSLILVLFFLLSIHWRREIFKNLHNLKGGKGLAFLGNQTLGATGFAAQSLAIALGPVALINALQGVQYVFVIILAALASLFLPGLVKERISAAIIIQKIIAVIIIAAGLYLITV